MRHSSQTLVTATLRNDREKSSKMYFHLSHSIENSDLDSHIPDTVLGDDLKRRE